MTISRSRSMGRIKGKVANVMSDLIKNLDAETARAAFSKAEELNVQERTERVIREMSAAIDKLRAFEDDYRIVGLMIDIQQKRIEALKAGEFHIGRNDVIVFNDAELNKRTIDHSDGRVTSL